MNQLSVLLAVMLLLACAALCTAAPVHPRR